MQNCKIVIGSVYKKTLIIEAHLEQLLIHSRIERKEACATPPPLAAPSAFASMASDDPVSTLSLKSAVPVGFTPGVGRSMDLNKGTYVAWPSTPTSCKVLSFPCRFCACHLLCFRSLSWDGL